MKTKTFKLNHWQRIIIPVDHPIFNDALLASLANQSISDVVKDVLMDKRYFLNYEHWYHPDTVGSNQLIKL